MIVACFQGDGGESKLQVTLRERGAKVFDSPKGRRGETYLSRLAKACRGEWRTAVDQASGLPALRRRLLTLQQVGKGRRNKHGGASESREIADEERHAGDESDGEDVVDAAAEGSDEEGNQVSGSENSDVVAATGSSDSDAEYYLPDDLDPPMHDSGLQSIKVTPCTVEEREEKAKFSDKKNEHGARPRKETRFSQLP